MVVGVTMASDRNGLCATAAHPGRDDQPRQCESGEQRGENADAKCHREAFHSAGADEEEHGGSDEGGDVEVEDGGERG